MRILLTTCLVSLFLVKLSSGDPSLDAEWSDYKQLYSKEYQGPDEEKKRRTNFESTLQKIKSYNKDRANGTFKFTLGLNQFSDMTPKEMTNMMGLIPPAKQSTQANTYVSSLYLSNPPDQVDLRTIGIVTGVKNQGQCGSCWAFSTTGSIEGLHAMQTGILVSLSEQNLVDCTRSYGNLGCGGGYMTWAFNYVIQNGGIAKRVSYPYTAKDGNCTFNSTMIGATITGYVVPPKGDEQTLKQIVGSNITVSVGVDASLPTFQSYSTGIYNDPSCSTSKMVHAVLVVGYGTDNGTDYWLLKNSWGTSWGLQGYMKLARNNNNQCGITTLASYPTV